MLLGGGYDIKIHQSYAAYFWGLFDEDQIVGVINGHQTSQDSFRSRGIYVSEDYRGKGCATRLINKTEEQGRKLGCKIIWSAPRKSTLSIFKNCGFETVSGPLYDKDGFEFGPNYYVSKKL